MTRKVGIIGVGNVGSQVAFSLCTQGICDSLVLIDKNAKKAQSEAFDLLDMAAYTHPVSITTQDYDALDDADVVILAAGPEMMAQEDRLSELDETLAILDDILPKLLHTAFRGIFVVITNPCDVVTHFVQERTGWDKQRVFGTGTALDTARMKRMVGSVLHVSPSSVEGFVLGEHGDSQFVAWSTVSIAGKAVTDFAVLDGDKIEQETRDAGWAILQGKGCTSFGIGTTAAMVTQAILTNEQRIIPVSTFDAKTGVYIGLPALVGRDGATTYYPKLNSAEKERYDASVAVIKQAIESKSTKLKS
ncbi:L-lactate dehydrogenase [Listeria booriae]|uniref:L-lactate dehydrogenase n=1 Tax=Listeria booriae TaxID=1552123 RepID=UPI001626A391|nr:L-lactate dehydrogenase [Listeria booriae]MBC1892091.1 L-lactate dehydrogenase [Listeria booriae]